MRTGRYCLRELLTHNEIDQIIIPELQRDYVWKEKNVKKLLNSIIRNFEEKKDIKFKIHVEDEILKEDGAYLFLKKEYERLKFNLKLGFIYAYHDNEYAGKFFLIDGQQRFTTLYLLLLHLYVQSGKQEEFRKNYFLGGSLKIDYKVRESSHDFMLEFVRNELSLNPVEITSSKNYYSLDYKKDETIQNLIHNFKTIKAFFEEKDFFSTPGNSDLLLEYIEDFIEFNYFDTNLSEQGEQLYLYMNSRGEHLSHQELLKSEILKKIDETADKKRISQEWENWQNFFWRKRDSNENADVGFQEFLKWVSIIEIGLYDKNEVLEKELFIKENDSLREIKERYLKRETKKEFDFDQNDILFTFQVENLTSEKLEGFYRALKYLFQTDSRYIPISEKWLASNLSTLDYFVLLPVLYYLKVSDFPSNEEKQSSTIRLAMFLKNLTYTESVSKNPDVSTIDAINLVKKLCDDNATDITHFLNEKFSNSFRSLLSESEIFKLQQLNAGLHRPSIEKLIWEITLDHQIIRFFEGNLNPLFSIAETHPDYEQEEGLQSSNNIIIVEKYYKFIKNYFYPNRKKDRLRRALLTVGDYSFTNSKIKGSWSFGDRIEGYSFAVDHRVFENEWLNVFQKEPKLVREFLDFIAQSPSDKVDEECKKLIKNFNDHDWRYNIIKHPQILKYCNNKRILRKNDRIILIQDKQAGYKELPNFLLKAIHYPSEMWIFSHNINVIDFVIENNQWINKMDSEDTNKFAIDIEFTEGEWLYSIIYRNEDLAGKALDPFLRNGYAFTNIRNKVEKADNLLYTMNSAQSLKKNLIELKDKIEQLKIQLLEILKEPVYANSN